MIQNEFFLYNQYINNLKEKSREYLTDAKSVLIKNFLILSVKWEFKKLLKYYKGTYQNKHDCHLNHEILMAVEKFGNIVEILIQRPVPL